MQRILFNAKKHHLATIITQINLYSSKGESQLTSFLKFLAENGLHREGYNGIIDIYEGKLTVEHIKREIVEFLNNNDLNNRESYQNYIETHGEIKRIGYYIMFSLSDTTELTLRTGDKGEQFVHIHPGRYSPNTFRVKANPCKTAIVSQFLACCRGISPNLELVNEARAKMELSPVPKIPEAISEVLQKLELHSGQ